MLRPLILRLELTNRLSQSTLYEGGCVAIIIGIVIQMSIEVIALVAEWIAIITVRLDLAGIVCAGLRWKLAREFLTGELQLAFSFHGGAYVLQAKENVLSLPLHDQRFLRCRADLG